MVVPTGEEYLRHLRDALHHLSDFDYLRASPLAALFGLARRMDAPVALQHLLTDAIQALEPAEEGPAQERDWRIYELLYYRYVEQLSPQEVANQLGIGDRHLRREQQAAIEALAQSLWQRHGLGEVAAPRKAAQAETQALNAELAWLRDAPPESPADLGEALAEVTGLCRPLLARYDTALVVDVPAELSHLAVHPVALSQALLNLLSVAIRWTPRGRVEVSARASGYTVEVTLCGVRGSTPQATEEADAPRSDAEDQDSLQMAARLIDLSGGRLAPPAVLSSFEAQMTLPALESVPILALDDNADTLQLLARYTTGTPYRLCCTRDPAELLDLADRLAPAVILLDVMMPQVDGWKVMAQLRQRPATAATPIVICTILPQEELALSLGATAFLRKPVTRGTFLTTLAQALRQEPGPG